MREQEFKARDKVVQKMSRGGLYEKNLTKGTERDISQRDSDFSFQAHGEGKKEEGMAGRTAARGRESLRQSRSGYSLQTEKGGEGCGAFPASADGAPFLLRKTDICQSLCRNMGKAKGLFLTADGVSGTLYSRIPYSRMSRGRTGQLPDRAWRPERVPQNTVAWRQAAGAGIGKLPDIGILFR